SEDSGFGSSEPSLTSLLSKSESDTEESEKDEDHTNEEVIPQCKIRSLKAILTS
ncbi:hypothetical protein SARC_13319, partial [Sphaeroforma arctica JP610]